MTTVAIEDYAREEDNDDIAFAFARAQDAVGDDGVIEMTRQRQYLLKSPLVIKTRVSLRGVSGRNAGTLIKSSGDATIMIPHPSDPAYSDVIPGWCSLENFTLLGTGSTKQINKNGITINKAVDMYKVHIESWPGHGIEISQANVCTFDRVRTYMSGLSGWWFHGADSNQSELRSCFADLGGRRPDAEALDDNHGFWDDSFLGNQYYACHSDMGGNNPTGRSYKAVKASSSANFFGCYSEGNKCEIIAPNYAYGGHMGPHPLGRGVAGFIRSTSGIIATDLELVTHGSESVSARLGRRNTDEVMHFYDQDGYGYKLQRLSKGAGKHLWNMLYRGISGYTAFGLTKTSHSRGAGHLDVPRGVISMGVRQGAGTSSPPTQNKAADVWAVGDIFWNRTSSGPTLWRCTAVSADGTLTWEARM